jgi:hypothetical protein
LIFPKDLWNTRPLESALQSALTTAQEENKKLLSALISMCEQYLQQENGTLFHMFMSAGEEATELLEDMGYLTCDNRENYSWTDKRQSALNGLECEG